MGRGWRSDLVCMQAVKLRRQRGWRSRRVHRFAFFPLAVLPATTIFCSASVRDTLFSSVPAPLSGATAMNAQEAKDEWIVLGENDPPPDLSREDAAFERERLRLVREQLGKIAVVHGDEVFGVFPTLFEAETAAYRRFGVYARLVFYQITEDDDEPEWVSNVDLNHPSVRRID